jgi:hypothetical protein
MKILFFAILTLVSAEVLVMKDGSVFELKRTKDGAGDVELADYGRLCFYDDPDWNICSILIMDELSETKIKEILTGDYPIHSLIYIDTPLIGMTLRTKYIYGEHLESNVRTYKMGRQDYNRLISDDRDARIIEGNISRTTTVEYVKYNGISIVMSLSLLLISLYIVTKRNWFGVVSILLHWIASQNFPDDNGSLAGEYLFVMKGKVSVGIEILRLIMYGTSLTFTDKIISVIIILATSGLFSLSISMLIFNEFVALVLSMYLMIAVFARKTSLGKTTHTWKYPVIILVVLLFSIGNIFEYVNRLAILGYTENNVTYIDTLIIMIVRYIMTILLMLIDYRVSINHEKND